MISSSDVKAGKVRSQTPKIPVTPKRRPVPRVRAARFYRKRIVLGIEPGQREFKR